MINIIKQGLISKLDNIKRFNGYFTFQPESVSSHSYWVTFYANLLFRDLFYLAFKAHDNGKWNWKNCYMEMYNFLIRQAINHDIEEAFSQDILHGVKYHEKGGYDIRKGLSNIVLDEINCLQPGVLKQELQAHLSSDTEHEITNLTTEQKRICHNILKLCDWFSVYHYSLREVELGNHVFGTILQRTIDRIRTCRISLLSNLEASHLPYSQAAIESII